MSETKEVTGQPLDAERVSEVSGGALCSADEIDKIITGLRENYDRLVEFTSYVMERVGGGPTSGP